MRHNFVFSPADAQQINKKMMAQQADSNMASALMTKSVSVENVATRTMRSARITFSVKEMNDAMTQARKLLTA